MSTTGGRQLAEQAGRASTEIFEKARAEGRAALVGYLPAGYPTVDGSVEMLSALVEGGCDLLEVGVPYSDPVMDGPTIQAAADIALRGGVRLRDVFRVVERVSAAGGRAVVMTYFNPVLRYGPARLAREAVESGVDGVLVTDLPPEEAGGWIGLARETGLDTVFLAAPTSSDARLGLVAGASRGFVYAVSRTGVTGETHILSDDARPLVRRLKSLTDAPVALGFGIATPEQVRAAAEVADGVVVGSALVRFLEETPEGDLAGRVRWLKSAM